MTGIFISYSVGDDKYLGIKTHYLVVFSSSPLRESDVKIMRKNYLPVVSRSYPVGMMRLPRRKLKTRSSVMNGDVLIPIGIMDSENLFCRKCSPLTVCQCLNYLGDLLDGSSNSSDRSRASVLELGG